MVYLILNKENNHCKIGYSCSPEKRLLQLQTANAEDLELLAVIDGDKNTEKHLHELFKNHKLKGEWFELVDEIKTFFNVLGQECFFYTYPDALALIDDLDKVSIKVLYYCNINAQWNTNMIALTKPVLLDIEKKIGLKYQTVRNAISKLKKLNILIDLGSATYRINPRYYWKGNSSDRLKTMKYVLEVECEFC